ncbi:acyl-CoA thioesterase [Virgibacillus oceani]
MSGAWHQKLMRVQYKDTDQMGVVHHGNYIIWFEVGRTEWMRHFGMAYHQLEEAGLLLPVADVNVNYKESARFDDCVAVFTRIANYSPIRLEFEYETRKISEGDFSQIWDGQADQPFGELLAKGLTKHMWVDRKWKPVRINKVNPEIYTIVQNTGV